MIKIIIVCIGFALGVTLSSITVSPTEDFEVEVPQSTDKIRLETSKRVRGIVDKIDFNKRILTVAYQNEYDSSIVDKIDIYLNTETRFKIRVSKGDNEKNWYLWWTKPNGKYTDIELGDRISVVGDDKKGKINVRDVSYPQKNMDNTEVVTSSNNTIKGVIDYVNKEDGYLIVSSKTGYVRDETQRVKIHFKNGIPVEKSVFLQKDGIIYSQKENTLSNMSAITKNQVVHITYDTLNDRLMATGIIFGDPYPTL